MLLHMLKGKIHRATVTQAELNYVGSITVDEALMDAAGIREYEKVAIVDVNNGARFETYVIAGERNSGTICLNGAAARCVSVGDKVGMGQAIGAVGTSSLTEVAEEPHLHFSLRVGGESVNPLDYISAATMTIVYDE